MLEIFAPYMLFISFLLTVLFNLWLISKNTRWFVIIIANLLLIVIMEFLDLAEYNFLNKIVDWIFDFLGGIFGLSELVPEISVLTQRGHNLC